MNERIAERMDKLIPSGIRKVNEKALAMERAGERVLHFELDVPISTLRIILRRRRSGR